MCGIFGIWQVDHKPADLALVQQATATLRHRGPDDEGYLLGDTHSGHIVQCGGSDTDLALGLPDIDTVNGQTFNLAFGFRRLAILDLSPAGHQPMASVDGHFYIIFNGEIYNYLELRTELMSYGYEFRTETDTEVILAAYQQWGVECLSRFNGMWAFALWDNYRRQLFCARDRFGIKPFYYWFGRSVFAFASEIKALFQIPAIKRYPNDSIIYDYLTYSYLDHTDETFFKDIKQLPAAHYLVYGDNDLKIRRYWNLDPSQKADPVSDETIYYRQFYDLFEDAVRIHLRSDVPIGTCLSGGLDSSSIVCVANKLLFSEQVVNPDLVGKQQKTFSSCFEDRRFDEREYIEQILAVTNTESNYVFPKGKELIEDLPRLMWHQDEPFASTSIYAQWQVMEKVAKRGVKVLLDGQGGDEVLAGYQLQSYYWASLLQRCHLTELWSEIFAYRKLYGASLASMAMHTLVPYIPPLIKKHVRFREGMGLSKSFAHQYRYRRFGEIHHYPGPLNDRLYALLTHYRLPALLRYEDKNSMAFSIEARVPFLDYRLVEFVFSLPGEQKIQHGLTKVILRNSLQDVLPKPVQMRTDKMGFVTPEKVWFTGELNGWIRDIVGSELSRKRGYFDAPQILKALDDYVAGQRDLAFLVWRWLNLELWFRKMIDTQISSTG